MIRFQLLSKPGIQQTDYLLSMSVGYLHLLVSFYLNNLLQSKWKKTEIHGFITNRDFHLPLAWADQIC